MRKWVRRGGSGQLHEHIFLRARAPLAVGIYHEYCMQHVAFRGPTVATAHAHRALSFALTARTK
eukprot:5287892-Pyramimonas_sp.AAC.1